MKIIKAIIISILLVSQTGWSTVYSQTDQPDFIITSHLELKYEYPSESVKVVEKYNIRIENSDYFYRAGLEQSFYLPDFRSPRDIEQERKFKMDSLVVKDQHDIDLKYRIVEKEGGMELITNTSSRIDKGNPYTITLSYDTHDLISVNGNISNIYIPGLPKDTRFSETDSRYGLSIRYDFSATLITQLETPDPSHLQPKSIKKTKTNKEVKYTVPTTERIGKNAWIQLGNEQYYSFRIEQDAKKTDSITPPLISNITDIASSNIYRIALPREYEETEQTTLIKSIQPEPYKVERDQEGNIFALFKVPANTDSTIVIEGYIKQSKPPVQDQRDVPNTPINDYLRSVADDPKLKIYTRPDKYWESDDPVIKGIATELLDSSKTISELVRINYDYIVNTFDYSYDKLESGNIRLGAKAALTGSPTICMEYSDALTAIFRAQGVPARIAVGYGNDPTGAENKISNVQLAQQKIAHQWTQVWIPEFGWLSIDPTWGESEREYIGSDLDHILWYAVGSFDERVAETTVYSADSISSEGIGDYRIFLQALSKENFNNIEGVEDATSLVERYKGVNTYSVDFTLRTSMLGRVLVYVIPAVTVFTTVLVLSLITKKIFNQFRRS